MRRPIFRSLSALGLLLLGGALHRGVPRISTDSTQPYMQIPSLPGLYVYAVYTGPGAGTGADKIFLGSSTLLFCTQAIASVCSQSAVGDTVALGKTNTSGFLALGGNTTYFDPNNLNGSGGGMFGTIELDFDNTTTGAHFDTSNGTSTSPFSYHNDQVFMDFISRPFGAFPFNYDPATFAFTHGNFNGEAVVDEEDITFNEALTDPNDTDFYNDASLKLKFTQAGATAVAAVPEAPAGFIFALGLIGAFAAGRRRLLPRKAR